MLDLNVLAEEIAAIVKEQVDLAIAPLVAANVMLATRLTAAEARSTGLDDIAVRGMIDNAIGAVHASRVETSLTPAEVQLTITTAVDRALAPLIATNVTLSLIHI